MYVNYGFVIEGRGCDGLLCAFYRDYHLNDQHLYEWEQYWLVPKAPGDWEC